MQLKDYRTEPPEEQLSPCCEAPLEDLWDTVNLTASFLCECKYCWDCGQWFMCLDCAAAERGDV